MAVVEADKKEVQMVNQEVAVEVVVILSEISLVMVILVAVAAEVAEVY